MNHAPLTQSRFQALLEAYGARPEHWPEGERSAAIELLETSESARILAREQHALDAWLSLSIVPAIPTELIQRLHAIPERQGKLLLARRLRVRAFLVPALGWAAAAVVGIWLGARSASLESAVVKAAPSEETVAQIENERLALSGGILDESEEP